MDTDFPAILRAHWKRLVWMWLFPPAFLGTVLIPAFSRNPFVFFLIVDLPAFFLCYYIASKPVRSREITVGQGVVFVLLLPFVLWALMIFGLFGVVGWLGSVGSH